MRRGPRHRLALGAGLAALATAPSVRAAGYDQPVPFVARQLGMGGTALAAVDDPSATAQNPAGLAWVDDIQVLGGLTLMAGRLRSVPEPDTAVESETMLAPLPFASAAARVLPGVSVGVAVYPIAAAGAAYEYEGAVGRTRDEARAAFFEAGLGVGVQLPLGLALGAAHRSTYATLSRYKRGDDANGPGIDLNQAGVDFTGFRLGAQWHALDDSPSATGATRHRLRVGGAYRHRTEIEIDGDSGTVLSLPARDTRTTLLLPTRAGAGLRCDFGRFGAAFEADYVHNADNDRGEVAAELSGAPFAVPVIYDWTDAVTLRAGAEVRALGDGSLALRAGLVRDGTSASRAYPSPFGPPPAPTWVVTLGAGSAGASWAANLGYGMRWGGTTVNDAELGRDGCAFCGYAGEYSARLHLISADFSRRFF